MEYCPRRIGAITRLFSEPVSDSTSAGWHVHNHPVQRTEVICPKPLRMVRHPCFKDNHNRCNCKNKSLNVHINDDGLDILDFILGKDDLYFDLETNGEGNFFSGSPPVRVSNPIVQDAEFVKQSLSLTSPLGNPPYSGGGFSPRMEISSPSCASSYSGSPKVRVEGFPSGNSECRSVVSGRA